MAIKLQFTIYVTLIVLFVKVLQQIDAIKCDRTPDGHAANKSPADGRYRIRIAGNPERYVAGEVYTVSVAGIRSMQVAHKFTGFMLTVDKDSSDGKDFATQQSYFSGSAGIFQLFGDALTRISERCPNMVTQTSFVPKSDVQVLWTAPPAGSGCVIFRATVIEHRDVWYMDDGPLSKMFCEDEQESIDAQDSIIDPCCACDEAKYELTFEGLWSRHTHPKDFPSNGWLTRFSDIIGASHTVDYRFWEYGQAASEGLQQVAEHGSTRMLESELKEQSENIRTIIKARGISYPNITGRTFAVFRVDSKHHLVSLVSMIDPSPDWIVGISGMELCTLNCSWIEQKTLNLYPWDAGTDSGPSYISPDQPTNPKDVIRRIKSNFPNDLRSPFYDPNGAEMKPIARLYLSRQRLYEKSCDNSGEDGGGGGGGGGVNGGGGGNGGSNQNGKACETGQWSGWSSCSVQCGKGKRHRQRSYLNPMLASQMLCTKKLTQREECIGKEKNCSDNINDDQEQEEAIEPECALGDWSAWSSCTASCGRGTRTRSRKYVNRKAMKKCQRGTPNPPMLEQNEECWGNDCVGDIDPMSVRERIDDPKCETTEWSSWGPCSTTCGLGKKIRTRLPINKAYELRDYQRQIESAFNIMTQSNEDDSNEANDINVLHGLSPNDPCANVTTYQVVTCGFGAPQCGAESSIPDYCSLEPKVGHCRMTTNRWFYDSEKDDCIIFAYTGCGGNDNNFLSREICLSSCKYGNLLHNIPSRSQIRGSTGIGHNHNEKIDCKWSHWSKTSCNVTCGKGYRLKTRTIVVAPQNGGQECPVKLQKVERCQVFCDPNHDTNPSWGPGNRITADASYHQRQRQHQQVVDDCRYSAWSSWSPCSKSCGEYAVQQRTRYPLDQPNDRNCLNRVEERDCPIMSCLLTN